MKKDTLFREYITNDLTQNQIAEKYNISRTTVHRLLKKFDITIKPAHQKPDQILTETEEAFIFGKILGDGCLYKHSSSLNYRFSFAHAEKQKEYIFYCHSFISRWCVSEPVYREQKRDEKIYSTPVLKKYVLETISHPEFSRLHKYFYDHGKKIVNLDILNSLTDLSLAIWYMDDGSIEIDRRVNKVTGAKIATNCFPLESVQLICKWLKTKYNITTNANKTQLGKDGLPQYCLRISKGSLNDFFAIIRPYVIDSMKYKISN